MTADVLPQRNVAQGESDTADIVQVVIIVAARLPRESARSDDVERVGTCMYGVYCMVSRWSWFKLGKREREVVYAYSTLYFQLFSSLRYGVALAKVVLARHVESEFITVPMLNGPLIVFL